MPQHKTTAVIKGVTSGGLFASMERPTVITSISVNGTSWTITYSDGWIEQGGYQAVTSVSGYGLVSPTTSFNVEFNKVLFIKCTPVYDSTGTNDYALYGVEDVTETGFKYRKGSAGSNLTGFYWVAKGI